MKVSKMQEENLSLTESPSIHWKKFFNKFNEIEALPIKDWQAVHLIAYFCKRYKDHYKVSFSFRMDRSPSKCYELITFRKIAQNLSADPNILHQYIDWFFDNKIILKKRRITSLAYLAEINIVNEFKFKKL